MWKGEISLIACENLNEGEHSEIHHDVLPKFKIGVSNDPDIALLDTYIMSVYDRTFHNSQIMESALMPING
jgi:hypothetical protein